MKEKMVNSSLRYFYTCKCTALSLRHSQKIVKRVPPCLLTRLTITPLHRTLWLLMILCILFSPCFSICSIFLVILLRVRNFNRSWGLILFRLSFVTGVPAIHSKGVPPAGQSSLSIHCVWDLCLWWHAGVGTFQGFWWDGKAWHILPIWSMFVEKLRQVYNLIF